MADRGAYEYVGGSVPDVPVLISPIGNTTGIATSVDLTWNASTPTAADYYTWVLSLASSLSPSELDGTTTETFVSLVGLNNATKYYWAVSGTDITGTSSYSATESFNTIIEVPDVPLPSLPINHSVNVTTSPSFEWSEAARADTYNINISKYSNFTTLTANQVLSTTTFSTSGLSHLTNYYWRVNAENVGGNSSWSSTQDFVTIKEEPGLFSLISPTAGEIVSNNARFSWNTATGAEHYHLQLADNLAFNSGVILVDNVTETFASVTLPYGISKYWRAAASNVGGVGTWTTGVFFYIENTPTIGPKPVTTNKSFDLITPSEVAVGDNVTLHQDFTNRSLEDIDFDIMNLSLVTVSSNYSVKPTDEFVMIIANTCTITLPFAESTSIGQKFLIGNNSAITTTIDAEDLDINGVSTISLDPNYKMKRAIRMQTEYLIY